MTIPKSYEALAADLASEKILSKTLLGQKEAYMMLADKGGLDLSESKAREAALREEIEMAKQVQEATDAIVTMVDGQRDHWIEKCGLLKQRLTVAERRESLLASFAKEMIDAAFEGGSFDGSEIQEIAVKHGLLNIENRTEECGEVCACREHGFPSECYRKTYLIALKPAEGEGS